MNVRMKKQHFISSSHTHTHSYLSTNEAYKKDSDSLPKRLRGKNVWVLKYLTFISFNLEKLILIHQFRMWERGGETEYSYMNSNTHMNECRKFIVWNLSLVVVFFFFGFFHLCKIEFWLGNCLWQRFVDYLFFQRFVCLSILGWDLKRISKTHTLKSHGYFILSFSPEERC